MMFFLNTCKNVLKRGLLIELAATMRQVSLVILFAVFYLFFVKDAGDFSRITLFLTAIFYAIISYGTRILWKRHVLRNLRLGRKNSIVILTDWANLPQVREDIQHHSYELFQIRGIAVIDVNEKKTLPEKLGDIPFVAEGESVMDYLCHGCVFRLYIISFLYQSSDSFRCGFAFCGCRFWTCYGEAFYKAIIRKLLLCILNH